MFHKRKLSILIGAFVFSCGMLSLGYAFWTDSLELEGNANVNLSIRVIDDITETTTPEALVLMEEPVPNNGGGDVSSDTGPSPNISDPAETPPVEEPAAEEPNETPPAAEAPPADDEPADTPPVEEPADTPPAAEAPPVEKPADAPPAADTPAGSPAEGTEGTGEI